MPLFSRTFICALAVLSIGLSIVLSWVNSADDVCPYRRERSKLDSEMQQQRTYLINGEVDASRQQMDVVVVAGAWRRPNGSLSRGFRHRVVHGVRMAMLFGAKDVLFTGGLNDSAVALEFVNTLQDASNVLFPLPWVLALDDDARDVAMDLKALLSPYDHLPLAEALQRVGLAQQAAPPPSTTTKAVGRQQHDAAFQWPQFHTENASLTTFGNAVHTKKWLQDAVHQSPASKGSNSPFHFSYWCLWSARRATQICSRRHVRSDRVNAGSGVARRMDFVCISPLSVYGASPVCASMVQNHVQDCIPDVP
ncbi:membrane-associated protein, putative [Bodo saltans]|uniref:Membrane-associated protein, putative n=1 Tax=Bodo saltans TaxID=75058 RepID=A0A0S4JAR5_BODSA|nr:membrane-associated protein, putative [Bodo saltans]|eukprot:CUG87434.1 membrane-associated protein, putative [Bodo saltans]